MTRPALGILLALLFGCEQSTPPPPTNPITAIVGAKVIDGTAGYPIESAVVLVQGDTIHSVGPRESIEVPEGAAVIDAAGQTVIPGLIDLHTHYMQASGAELDRQLGVQLAWGATAARSIGVDDPAHIEQLRSARQRGVPAPRLLTAGLGFSHPRGHPVGLAQIYRPETPEQAREQALELANQRVDFIKMWVDSKYGSIPRIAPDVREAIIEVAAAHGIPVVAHVFNEDDFYHLAGKGVTDFLHTVRDRQPMDEKFLDLCRTRKISFIPTLTVIESNWLLFERPGLLLDDAEVRAASSAEAATRLADVSWRQERLRGVSLDVVKPELGHSQRFVKQMADNGIWLGVGSDSNGETIPHGWGAHNEMRLLVEAGIAPLDVLRIATAAGARRLGPHGADIGTLEPGKRADLLVLDADPTVDIGNARKISRIMQAGAWLDRAALLAANDSR